MATTYADLAAQPRYADAIAFFLSDLYGGADFAQRDADLARVVPVMTRMLPGRVIATIGEATELNVLSQELDRSAAFAAAASRRHLHRRRVLRRLPAGRPTARRARGRSDSSGKSAPASTTTWGSRSSGRRSR